MSGKIKQAYGILENIETEELSLYEQRLLQECKMNLRMIDNDLQ